MNVMQKIILVIGTVVTIFFLTFNFTMDVKTKNPYYNPVTATRWSSPFITEHQTDYKKKLTLVASSILGTAVLFFVFKTNKARE